MWHNKITNQFQSNTPWSGWIHPDLIAEQYPDWEEVGNDYTPPVPVPTKAERIAALNADYTAMDAELLKYWTAAAAEGDAETQADIQAERESLKTVYLVQINAIKAEGGN